MTSDSGDGVTNFVFFMIYIILLGVCLYLVIDIKWMQRQLEVLVLELNSSYPGKMFANPEKLFV